MAELILNNINKTYPNKTKALSSVSLNIKSGEILSVLGESGSGKSTLLRIIAGFELADTGEILLSSKPLVNENTFVKPEKRKIGIVFQDYALFPHLTVEKNVSFGISTKNKALIAEKVKYYLGLVELSGFEKRYPHTLSGGQLQRVAIARALAAEPDLLLLDEPLSNLDDYLKDKLRLQIRTILKKTGTTAILVTHDIFDALKIADKISIFNQGKLLQTDTAENIYRNPVNEFVAGIFSDFNIFKVDIAHNNLGLFGLQFNIENRLEDGKYNLLIYPQDIVLDANSEINARVIESNFAVAIYEIKLALNNEKLTLYSPIPIPVGTDIGIRFIPEKFIFIRL